MKAYDQLGNSIKKEGSSVPLAAAKRRTQSCLCYFVAFEQQKLNQIDNAGESQV
ncbi:hypothetical protein [Pontibacter pamirensis]|uniref:hypothetical protein n=1 Tax=Pontibacter pamirensis TaxID=2562824 RepID=UPI0013898C8B|nr:hypothetical protein [Pontibacter pamirensis]